MSNKLARTGGKQTFANGLTKKQMQALLDNDIDPTLYITKHNPTAPTAVPVHGSGGMFSQPGVNPDMYSAIVRPNSFIGALPLLKNEYQNELVSILTQQSATTGTNPSGTCGDPVTPGTLHKATISRRFGKVFIGSDQVDVTEVGMLNNRADIERRILNSAAINPWVPSPLAQANVNFRSEAAHQLWRAGIAFERAVASADVSGNSTLTGGSAKRGFLREFDGLDRIITSGITDSGGTLAPAADSLVITWGSTLGASVGGRRLAEALHEAVFSRIQLANKTGMSVTSWTFVGDERLFFFLTRELAVYYASLSYADAAAATPINRDLEALESRRNAMLDGFYLQLANFRIPFKFSSGDETTANASTGELTSNLYFVPLDEVGNPITYVEYFPMNNPFIDEFNALSNTTGRAVLNDGMYMMAVRSTGFCDQIMLAGHLRLICRAPFLGFRVDSLKYNPYIGFRSAFPGNTGFFGGGVSSYT